MPTFTRLSDSGISLSTSGVKSRSCFFTSAMVSVRLQLKELADSPSLSFLEWRVAFLPVMTKQLSRVSYIAAARIVSTSTWSITSATTQKAMDVKSLKTEIKAWENAFKASNKRNPTVDDIKNQPEVGKSRFVTLLHSWHRWKSSWEIQTLQKAV